MSTPEVPTPDPTSRAERKAATAAQPVRKPVLNQPVQQAEPGNPYFLLLFIVAFVSAILGVIFLVIGWTLAARFAAQTFGTIQDSGAAQLTLGGSLLGLAIIAFLVYMGAKAARWEAPK